MIPRPVEPVISSLDFVFPEDDVVDVGAPSSVTGLAVREGAVGAGPGAVTGGSGMKGRMSTSTTLVKPHDRERASKVNALAAITAGSMDDGDGPPSLSSSVTAESAATQLAAKRAPRLDLNSLRTWAPRFPNPPPRPSNRPRRIFGLEHCPIFHPSVEEFADPLEYIENVAAEARDFGICKIVPPEGWRPPFAVNTETFRFKTRLQLLNSMEASARASINFLEQLHIFHLQQGSNGIAVPTIAGRPLDLWRLKREVTSMGGYFEVSKSRRWPVVGKAMGYNLQVSTAACSQMKTTYLKIIVPFEDYIKRVKLAGGSPPPDPSILNDNLPSHSTSGLATTPKFSNGAESLPTPTSDVGGPTNGRAGDVGANDKVRTASDKLNEALNMNMGPHAEQGSNLDLLSPKKPLDDTPGEACEICTFDHDPDKIVLCDGCDRGYHLSCLSPPLSEVPTSQFFCDTCLFMNGAEYGFEEGQEHSLHSFRKRADAFKRQWLQDHPIPREPLFGRDPDPLDEQLTIEDHFEREFWRLVESQNESVEVEYGADVNLTADGGGFPSLENHPDDPYSSDGWNLNNLPILAKSLLRYIKSDISGMTIPWIYVGMVFSTFAWHKEDHYTYSINYHHWGDTKTWYGLPGMDDEKLEAAMKLAAPELFEQQPDLMFQLVTLMSPGRLMKHGVRVVACDQRPNEFVITFPRSYHAGFNHGFNFNEAVNFALPDWLPVGLACVKRYRDIKKNPVFSHDELLITIAQYEKSPESSRWLLPEWREMVERELAARAKFRRLHPEVPEVVDASEIEEEEYQCDECRVLAYLSQVLGDDLEEGFNVSCHDHVSKLEGPPTLFRLRYSDEHLQSMLSKVTSRSEKGRPAVVAQVKPEPKEPPRISKRRSPPPASNAWDHMPSPSQKVKTERYSHGDETEGAEETDDGDEAAIVAQSLLPYKGQPSSSKYREEPTDSYHSHSYSQPHFQYYAKSSYYQPEPPREHRTSYYKPEPPVEYRTTSLLPFGPPMEQRPANWPYPSTYPRS